MSGMLSNSPVGGLYRNVFKPGTFLGAVADPIGVFKKPETPAAPAAAPPPPSFANADLDQAARQQALGMLGGRSSTILNGGLGLQDMGSSSRNLLGR